MKKIAILLLMIYTSFNSFAQKIEEAEVTYELIRLPLAPLGEGVSGYNFTVETPYPINNDDIIANAKRRHEEAVANFPNAKIEAQKQYEQDLAQYESDVEIARENFKIESEQFNNLSMVERLAQADKKPVLKLPSKPYLQEPGEPVYYEPNVSDIITFDPEVLAGSFLKVDGLDKTDDLTNALVGVIKFSDFESNAPVRKSEVKSQYNTKTKQTEKKTVYYYVTEYKRPTYLKLTYKGETLYEGYYEPTTEYIITRTDASPNMKQLEKATIEDNLTEINEFINSNYGYTPIEYTTEINYVKNKNGEYDDVEEAKDAAYAAYKEIQTNEGKSGLEETLTQWEKIMDEVDLDDKKARIDKKVAPALMTNMIEAAIVLNSFDKAKSLLQDFKNMKLNYAYKEMAKSLEARLEEGELRFKANN